VLRTAIPRQFGEEELVVFVGDMAPETLQVFLLHELYCLYSTHSPATMAGLFIPHSAYRILQEDDRLCRTRC
jgi:hypothetical protein